MEMYDIVARPRGLAGHELPAEERAELAQVALHAADPTFEVMRGSERGIEPMELVPYDPGWPAQFESWRDRIAAALGPVARRIVHYGSTSIPGLAAKPVIDVLIWVDDMNKEDLYVPQLESIGLQLRNRDKDQRFLRPFPGKPRNVHVHVCDVDSQFARKDLLFAAFLRQDAAARAEYLHAKEQAVALWADDRIAYTEVKGEVIRPILARAEQWARETGWKP